MITSAVAYFLLGHPVCVKRTYYATQHKIRGLGTMKTIVFIIICW